MCFFDPGKILWFLKVVGNQEEDLIATKCNRSQIYKLAMGEK